MQQVMYALAGADSTRYSIRSKSVSQNGSRVSHIPVNGDNCHNNRRRCGALRGVHFSSSGLD